MAIITISRQVGSLGDEAAQAAAQELGYRLVGGEDFKRLAQECDDDFSKACQAFETEKSTGFFERLFFRESSNLAIFAAMNYELAAEGDVIIKGRGAQIVFAAEPGVLKVRVVAPSEIRAARMGQRKNISPEDAREFLRHYDRQRRGLIESVFHRDLADWDLYDLLINTRHMDVGAVTRLVVAAAQSQDLAAADLATTERFKHLAMCKRVEAAIKKRINTSPFRDMTVNPGDGPGEVVLTGFVPDKRGREKAEAIAKEQPRVTKVDNKLKTTELSF